MDKPQLTDQIVALAAAKGLALDVLETGGGCAELTGSTPAGLALSITDGDAGLPGTYPDDAEVYAYLHGPDDTEPITDLSTDSLTDLAAYLDEALQPTGSSSGGSHRARSTQAEQPPPPPDAGQAECCASGRCEVCTPGYNW